MYTLVYCPGGKLPVKPLSRVPYIRRSFMELLRDETSPSNNFRVLFFQKAGREFESNFGRSFEPGPGNALGVGGRGSPVGGADGVTAENRFSARPYPNNKDRRRYLYNPLVEFPARRIDYSHIRS